MVGFLCIGSVFAINELNIHTLINLFLYLLGSFFYVLSGYALNAYTGYHDDEHNERLSSLGGFSQRFYYYIVWLALGVFALAYSLIDVKLFLLSLCPFLLGLLYAFPKFGLKHYPLGGTLAHFLAQLFLFHMGYVVFEPYSDISLKIAIYFSLLLAAAHLHHEVIDHKADQLAGSRTSAVTFGWKKIESVSTLVYFLSGIYWISLFLQNLIEPLFFYPFLMAFIAQMTTRFYYIYQSIQLNGQWEADFELVYRDAYRIYYLLGGIVIIIWKGSSIIGVL